MKGALNARDRIYNVFHRTQTTILVNTKAIITPTIPRFVFLREQKVKLNTLWTSLTTPCNTLREECRLYRPIYPPFSLTCTWRYPNRRCRYSEVPLASEIETSRHKPSRVPNKNFRPLLLTKVYCLSLQKMLLW